MSKVRQLTLEELDKIIYKIIDRKTALTIGSIDKFKAEYISTTLSDFDEYDEYRDQIIEHWTREYFLGIEGRIVHQENTKLWQMIYDLRLEVEDLKKDLKKLKEAFKK
tara:strand:+ start:578 stop:901 length:324 start_codon:yes stop_codon:yes gene_type:complete